MSKKVLLINYGGIILQGRVPPVNLRTVLFLSVSTFYLKMIDPDSEEDMRAAFELIDVDKSGFISRPELRKFLDNLTQGTLEYVTEAEVDEIMRAGDTDGDQKINFEEFCKVMKAHQIL